MIEVVIAGPAPCIRCRTPLWYVRVAGGREWRDRHGLPHTCGGQAVENPRSHRRSRGEPA